MCHCIIHHPFGMEDIKQVAPALPALRPTFTFRIDANTWKTLPAPSCLCQQIVKRCSERFRAGFLFRVSNCVFRRNIQVQYALPLLASLLDPSFRGIQAGLRYRTALVLSGGVMNNNFPAGSNLCKPERCKRHGELGLVALCTNSAEKHPAFEVWQNQSTA